jgi:hypothetical protein
MAISLCNDLRQPHGTQTEQREETAAARWSCAERDIYWVSMLRRTKADVL